MHPEAQAFLVESLASRSLAGVPDEYPPTKILEFGSRDVNGSPRYLFPPLTQYVGVDIVEGEGVDIVGDASDIDLVPEYGKFDLLICMEVFEHTPHWPDILNNMRLHASDGAQVIVTAAADPRQAHSAVNGEHLVDWTTLPIEGDAERGIEFYKNVDPDVLRELARDLFTEATVTTHPHGDVYLNAWV